MRPGFRLRPRGYRLLGRVGGVGGAAVCVSLERAGRKSGSLTHDIEINKCTKQKRNKVNIYSPLGSVGQGTGAEVSQLWCVPDCGTEAVGEGSAHCSRTDWKDEAHLAGTDPGYTCRSDMLASPERAHNQELVL